MREKSPRISIPLPVRTYILQRDRQQCRQCGTSSPLEIDHIIPLAVGGTNDLSNLQVLCRPCNRQKKHRLNGRSHRHFTP
jgi:5-methylcytosine-specific restriction enzyme A